MNEIPTTIKLSGSLAKKFGREHKRVIFKTKDAIKTLCLTVEGFQNHMLESHKRGIAYAVFKGKKNLSADDLNFPNSNEEIRIVPVIMGSKRGGLFQTILGAVLVVVGAFTYAYGGQTLVMAGVSLMAGGIVQMLSPQTTGLTDTSDADNKPSYAFGGVKNTSAQGYPVPDYYGRRLVGGAFIAAGIYAEDQE